MPSQQIGQLLLFLATTSLLSSTASADTAHWLFPAYEPNAPLVVFESQDTIDASWTSSFVAPALSMFCKIGSDGGFSFKFHSPAPVVPNGTYAIPLDSVQDPDSSCHLNLNETNGPLAGTGNSSNSGNFLVNVQSDRPATTWSTSITAATTSTSIPTIISSSTTSKAAAASATATGASVAPQPNTSLSSGAKAGIGVGVSLGVLALILAGLLLWTRARRKRQRNPPKGVQKPEYGGSYASEMDGSYVMPEMDGRSTQGGTEKDGFPIARRQTAEELEADGSR